MSTMQPPPRKGNYTKFLKNLHSEQIAKLQLKNQHECDLLEDIRSYIIKKSSIEKSYSEALLRISSAYVNKKAPNIPDIKLEGGEEKWNMWNVWRLVLEENEKLARARLAAIEVFQQQIADEAKVLRAQKLQTAKKCTDQLAIVQKELQLCVQDVDKNKKIYYDEEHSAHDVRDKAKDIEEKLKKKKGSFFQSITSLQKNSAKFSSKREQLEEKSTGARNDYLLSLAAANAHQNRYFAVDLQMTMSIMENNVFDKVTEFLTLMGRTELLTCSATQNSYGKIRDQASQMTREYNLKCCYLYYPVLKQHIQYDYEPCDNDPIDHVTADHDSAAATLSREAKRWATRIARENNNIKESVRRLQIYNALRESGQRVDPNDPNGQDLETKIDDLKQSIRRSETAKMKAEARIECLRAGGVNVDEWVQEVETLSVQDIPRSASSLSVRTDGSAPGEQPSSDSFYDSEGEQQAPAQQQQPQQQQHSLPEKEDSEEQDDTQEVDAMLEQERQRIEQLTAGWDDPTQVDWGAEEHTEAESATESQNLPPPAPGLKCTALYSYTAQNPDELSIVENEQLEVVGEGDGDGWLRARNYRGEEGFVPQNYLDVERDGAQQAPGALASQISFSSVDYTVDEQDDADGFPGPGEISGEQTDQTQSPEQVSVISAQQRESDAGEPSSYCCALYDYDAGGADELSFEEGQIIRVINKCAHGVDDGWWEGELEGRIGNFPSLVVEECDENGEPLTNQWDETPPPSAPPVFTPPEIPNFMLQPAEVIITQATPMLEHAQQPGPGDVPNGNAPPPTNPPNPSETQQNGSGGFSMSLSKNQHKQYQENVKKTDIPCVMIEDESGHQEPGDGEGGGGDDDADFGLGVAQIVITAATPMMEEPEHGFPSVPEEKTNNGTTEDEITSVDEPTESDQKTVEEVKSELEKIESARSADVADEVEEKSTADDLPTDSAPFPTSSSSASDAGSTGPSTAENSQSCPAIPSGGGGGAMATRIDDDVLPDDEMPKQVVGGRASIPDELEPHQLAQLQDLKESNA